MAWPTPQDYNEAVQNPRLAFIDPDLRAGQPELNTLGLPRPIAGGFACVYKIKSGASLWAARCFLSEVADQHQRYNAISKHLADAKLPHTVPFTYLQTGIKVQGRGFPLVKMQWVQGETLSTFVSRTITYPDTLLSLAKVWSKLLADLKAANIAHGDLQHGNVVVVGDQLRLIDYDGMFVPGLAGKLSNECGHRNFQLPARTGCDYGPHLDNFSAWVIYVSLVALAIHPELWGKHRGGDECLIFRKEDFLNPESSLLLRDLNSSANSQLRFLVEVFTSLFKLSPHDVPALDGNLTKITTSSSTHAITQRPNPQASWWSDHREPSQKASEQSANDPTRAKTIDHETPDPSWILDSLLEETPEKPLSFNENFKEVRIMMVGSWALVALTRFLVEMPPTHLLMLTTCVFGLNLLLCYVRYKGDPNQSEFEVFKNEVEALARRVQEHQVVMDSIAAERSALQEALANLEGEIQKEKNRLGNALQDGLNKAQAELDSQSQLLNKRRQVTITAETQKLNSLQGTLGFQINELEKKVLGLKQREAAEINAATITMLDSHILNYLQNHRINDHWIPSVGATYKARLFYKGFVTAADISWRVRSVSGIGATREAALVAWRQELERDARACAPSLTKQARLLIESKYRHERNTNESAKQQLQTQLDNQIVNARQFFTDLRQSLNVEEQQLRTACAQLKARLQQDQNIEIAKLVQKTQEAKQRAAPAINELTQKLQQAQKQLFGLRWQSVKREKEGKRFNALRFNNYLRKVLAL